MKKARSRLSAASTQSKKNPPSSILQRYLIHLPMLFASASFLGIVGYVTTHFYPEEIQFFIYPNSYLAIMVPLFGGLFFLSSYLLLNTRRGFILSSALTILAYCYLLQVIVPPVLIAVFLTWFAILELLCTLASHYFDRVTKKL